MMSTIPKVLTLLAAPGLLAVALVGCSDSTTPKAAPDASQGKMEGGSMEKGKMDGAMDQGKMDGGSMEKGKMDGAMDQGKMDGAMDKGKMDGAMDKGKMDGPTPK